MPYDTDVEKGNTAVDFSFPRCFFEIARFIILFSVLIHSRIFKRNLTFSIFERCYRVFRIMTYYFLFYIYIKVGVLLGDEYVL